MKEGWVYKKLGEVCEIYGRIGFRGYTREDYVDTIEEGAISLSPSNIINNQLDFSNCTYITWDKYNQSPEIKIVEDDVIFVKTASVGKCAYVSALPHESTINPQFVVFKNISISNRFLFYQLLSSSFQYKVKRITSGTSVPTITQKGLSDLSICYPNIAEQQRIVSELDLLSGIIERKKAQLKEYDQLAQSIFYDMFGDILEANPTMKLKDVASYFIGLTYKPSDVSEQGTVVLRSSNIQNNILDFNDIVRVNLNVSDNKTVKEGDILMCARNGSARLVGKVARITNLEEKMSFGAFMTIIRSKYNEYLFHFFLSDFFRAQLTTSKTATINQITSKMLDNISINVPPLSLQQSFAEKIEAIEKQKALIQQSIKETETLFNSRMDYYFN